MFLQYFFRLQRPKQPMQVGTNLKSSSNSVSNSRSSSPLPVISGWYLLLITWFDKKKINLLIKMYFTYVNI